MFIKNNYLLLGLIFFTVFFSCKKEDTRINSTQLEIVSIWPESGTADIIVKINGYHFSPIRTENKVQINGKDATVIEASATELQVVTPKGTGSGNITLTVNGEKITGPAFTYKKPTDQGGQKVDSFYVKTVGKGDGSSWGNATSLDSALKHADNGSVIFIAAGTYTPNTTITDGNENTQEDKTFEINKNITLQGGYPENASDIHTPADPSANKTTLSGQLSNTNAYHVVAITAPKAGTQQVVLSGLTITGGNSYSSTSSITINGVTIYRNGGGGMIIGNSKVEINNCKIIDNNSQNSVAGLFIVGGSDVTIINSEVKGNVSAKGNGAGIWAQSSKLTIYNSEINDNQADGTGPGIYGYPNSTITLYNSTVANNKGTSFGAAVYVRQSSKVILVNCLIYGNQSSSTHGGGGLMMYDECSATILSSTFTKNNIQGPGGGVYRQKGSNTLTIYNSILSGNQQSGSSDIDDDGKQPAPKIISSVIGLQAYNSSGDETGDPFDPNTMFDKNYKPIGTNDPALSYGMSATDLNTLGNKSLPSVENKYLVEDINKNSRSGIHIMGAVVK